MSLPCQGPKAQRLHGSLFEDLNQVRLCTKFLSQMRPLALLCRWGRPQVMLSVQLPLWKGLLDALHIFPCALLRFSGWMSWRIFQEWVGLWICFSACAWQKNWLQASKALCLWSWLTLFIPQVPCPNMAASFVVKSVNSACRTALLKHAQLQISRCSAQAFRLGRTGIYTQQWSWVRN